MIRVFQTDLLKQRHKDLFAAPLSPHSVSMRYANPDVAAAVMEVSFDAPIHCQGFRCVGLVGSGW